MIAADTNIVVRLLTGDEPEQTAQARCLFKTAMIFVTKTVLPEAKGFRARLYRLGRAAINKALEGLLSLANVRAEDEPLLREALAWNRDGMNLADVRHLASSRAAARFATFDMALIKAGTAAELDVYKF